MPSPLSREILELYQLMQQADHFRETPVLSRWVYPLSGLFSFPVRVLLTFLDRKSVNGNFDEAAHATIPDVLQLWHNSRHLVDAGYLLQ